MYKITGADLGKVVQRIDERYENRLWYERWRSVRLIA
jgi:hypothetical protein